MKILVLSLLRIGDVALSAPAIRGLRDRHPSATLHVAINRQCRSIAPLMSYVDRFIEFDRETLQRALGEPERPVFEAYERVTRWLDDINSEGYDLVVNLTHSRISGWLMGLIEAKERLGLCMDAQGRASFGHPWFRYLNNQVGSESAEVFHFADVFRFGLGIDDASGRLQTLVESKAGQAEALQFLSENSQTTSENKRGRVCVQPLTSDKKKDWSREKYARAISMFAEREPDAEIFILGAPFERDQLLPLIDELQSQGVRAKLAILSLEGAFSLLKRSQMLLTGDTSIKHLAAAARTTVVEIALGSADPYRTGAYRNKSIILKSREGCAPCVHSNPCHQSSHACSIRLSADLVSMVMSEVFHERYFQLATLAQEYRNEAEILKVDLGTTTFFAAISLGESFTESSVARWIDFANRRIHLESNGSARTKEIADGLGTETFRLVQLFKSLHPEVSPIEWKQLLEAFEKQSAYVEDRIRGFKNQLRILQSSYEDSRKLHEFVLGLIAFRERIKTSPFLGSFKTALDTVIEDDISPAFTRFKYFCDLVGEMEKRTDINLRMIRALTVFEPQLKMGSP